MPESLRRLSSLVAALSPREHGFAYFDPDAAQAQWRAQQHRVQRSQRLRRSRGYGRLSGWIIPAKDLSDVAGMPTTLGNRSRTYMATETDPFLLRCLRQGAIIPGKTLAPELGLTAYTEPVGLPHPDNPTLPGHTPGGSSGGAAVMVARGLVRAAHASDGGGSIRIPAACTGIVGYKPPHDTGNANPVAQGFLAGTLTDSAYVNNVTVPARVPRLRVGVLIEPVHAEVEVSEHMLSAVDRAASALSKAGHDVMMVRRPYGDAPFAAFHDILSLRSVKVTGEASPLVSWLRDRGSRIGEHRKEAVITEFMSVKSQVLRAWDVDVLLSPMLAFDPPPIGYFRAMSPESDFYAQTQWTPWATMFNMAGLGALVFPFENIRTPIHVGALRVSPAQLFGVAATLYGDSDRRITL